MLLRLSLPKSPLSGKEPLELPHLLSGAVVVELIRKPGKGGRRRKKRSEEKWHERSRGK
jgi:hypothetical protein